MHTLRLLFDHTATSAAIRRTVRHTLATSGDGAPVEDVLLVVSELVQNAMQHAGGSGTLALTRRDGTLLVEVTDTSPHTPRVNRPDPCRAGGRGLMIVAAMTRAWGTRPTAGGKVVWAEIPLSAPTPALAG